MYVVKNPCRSDPSIKEKKDKKNQTKTKTKKKITYDRGGGHDHSPPSTGRGQFPERAVKLERTQDPEGKV